MLSIINATPLQLATIRSLLASLIYIEISDTFIISCPKSFKDPFAQQLEDKGIHYIMIFVNLKTGCDVNAWGINPSDKAQIEKIVLDN